MPTAKVFAGSHSVCPTPMKLDGLPWLPSYDHDPWQRSHGPDRWKYVQEMNITCLNMRNMDDGIWKQMTCFFNIVPYDI